MKLCVVKGCEELVKAKGLCSKHHQRWYRYGSPFRTKNKIEEGQLEDHERFELNLRSWRA